MLLHRPATIRDLTEATGLPRGSVTADLKLLHSMGLVVRLATRPLTYRAAQPDIAVDALIHHRERAHAQASAEASQLMADFHAGLVAAGPSATVETLDDAATILQRYIQLQVGATEEVRMIDVPPYIVSLAPGEPNPFELEALGRAVRYRVIYDVAALDAPRKRQAVHQCIAAGEQARVLAGAPAKLHIADSLLAMVSGRSGPVLDAAVIVHPSPLLDLLSRLFDLLWSQASDLSGTEQLSQVESEILALLAAGEKDAAIARVLGLHVRTVRRHIEQLCGRLGASSRFMAGARASERGWL